MNGRGAPSFTVTRGARPGSPLKFLCAKRFLLYTPAYDAPSGIRTRTEQILSLWPLPLGYRRIKFSTGFSTGSPRVTFSFPQGINT